MTLRRSFREQRHADAGLRWQFDRESVLTLTTIARCHVFYGQRHVRGVAKPLLQAFDIEVSRGLAAVDYSLWYVQ